LENIGVPITRSEEKKERVYYFLTSHSIQEMKQITRTEIILLWIAVALAFIAVIGVIDLKLTADEARQSAEFFERRLKQCSQELRVCEDNL
jgi:hypothetical protein